MRSHASDLHRWKINRECAKVDRITGAEHDPTTHGRRRGYDDGVDRVLATRAPEEFAGLRADLAAHRLDPASLEQ
jgi:hypothetical protein